MIIHMKSIPTRSDFWAWFALLLGTTLGCSAGRPAFVANCGLTDNTVSCCVKKHVGKPEACGLGSTDATLILSVLKATEGVEEEEEEDDPNEGWRDQCINLYVACKQRAWRGNCHDCLRWCQGQKHWPFHMCRGQD